VGLKARRRLAEVVIAAAAVSAFIGVPFFSLQLP